MPTNEYSEIIDSTRTINTNVEDIAFIVYEEKWPLEKENRIIGLLDEIKQNVTIINDSSDTLDDLAEEDCESENTDFVGEINTGNGIIAWRTENLQDEQIMEAVDEAIKRLGGYKFLTVIQNL